MKVRLLFRIENITPGEMPAIELSLTDTQDQALIRRVILPTEFGAPSNVLAAGADAKGHPLAGIVLQRELESQAYVLGGSSYEAPGQLVNDFLAGKPSTDFASVLPSYKPGVKLGDLAPSLPAYAIEAIREGE